MRTLAVALALTAYGPLPVLAYGLQDVAGTLNGDPVTLGEVDRALDGSVQATWARIDTVVRQAARALCAEYATVRIATEAGVDTRTWRAQQWAATRPSAAAIRAFGSAPVSTFGQRRPTRQEVSHLLHVRAYRHAVAAATDRLLAGDYTLALPAPPARFEREPTPTSVVAQCLGHLVTAHEVQAFAAGPLYRARAEMVRLTCRQFDIDYSNPVVLYRMAHARGLTVEELMREAEAGEPAVSDAAVEAAARAYYGVIHDAGLARARVALVAKRKVDGRMALLEQVRTGTVGACALEGPTRPTVTVRGSGPGGVPGRRLAVSYFGAFGCEQCAAGWRAVRRLRRTWGERIHVDVRQHFPVVVWKSFQEAVEARCSAWAGRFWEYVAWRGGAPAADRSPAQALDLTPAAFLTCIRDSTTAVAAIADADEALRLGFGDAVPSWVIGHQPWRGPQADRVLDDSVTRALRTDALRLTAPFSARR